MAISETTIGGKFVLITNRKLYMSFRLIPKSVTLNDLERHNGPYFALFHRICVRCRLKTITSVSKSTFDSLKCESAIVRTLAILNKGNIGMILSKYAIPSLAVSVADIKNRMWMHFVEASYDKL